MYYIENGENPDFTDISTAMWWAVATLTTVGYGDIYPKTPAGKVVASIVAFLGIGFFALPAAIIGSGFVELMEEAKDAAGAAGHDKKAEVLLLQHAISAMKRREHALALDMLEERLAAVTKSEVAPAASSHVDG